MATVLKYLVEHMDDQDIIHWDGADQPGDKAFCGADLMGDSFFGWKPAKPTTKKVNCPDCIKLLKHTKHILDILKSKQG